MAQAPDQGNGEAVWQVRPAEPRDRELILRVVETAFSAPDHDGRKEVRIVLDTWRLGAVIDGLELVADDGDGLIGHVLGARADVEGRELLAVAPLAVAPARQRQGVGTDLMNELLRRADGQGWPAAVLLGDPGYYGRFGFEPAGLLGLFYRPAGRNNPHFLARRLSSFGSSVHGEVRYCWETGAG